MDVPIRLGDLTPSHRARLESIVRATGVFSDDEVRVAVELVDEASAGPSGIDAAVPLSHPDYVFLGAFTPEDELVGYACYGPTPGTDRTYDLYWIAVDPEAHGAGIGTFLLAEVERRLLGHRARVLVVETSSRSDYAQTRRFYGRRGYAESACVREFYAPGDDRIIFTKRFQHSPQGGERSHHE